MSDDTRPFRFRLERILRLRRNALRSVETALRDSEREAQRLEDAAGAARNDEAGVRDAVDAALGRGVDGATHAGGVARQVAATRHRERSAESAREAWQRAAEHRSAWVAARRGVQALERLRERVRERFERDEERRGQQTLDEVATRRRGAGRLCLAALAIAAAVTAPAHAQTNPSPQMLAPDSSAALSADRLLLEIADRQAAFDRRERELEAREASVQELEARVAERIEELQTLRADLEAGLSSLDEESELRVRQLAKVYASMPPERAAPLLEDIDRDLATAVLRRMKHKKSAAVMALLSRPAALSLSRRVAHPLVRGEGGL